MKFSKDYPGGNILVKGFETGEDCTEIFLEQEIRDSDRWWFYWNFRVDDAPAGKVRFSFSGKPLVCPWGAAVSTDGISWHYDTAGYEDGLHFSYIFDGSGKSVYFAFTLPYQVSHFEEYYKTIQEDPRVARSTLCQSEQGREVPLLVFGEGDRDVVFSARSHCCESTASYVLEGVINALLGEYSYLLKQFRFHVIPFIDIDGAENGDQGKGRKPHDHNRDFTENAIYLPVKAIVEYGLKLNNYCMIDFHSPWKWGDLDSRPHIHMTGAKDDPEELEEPFAQTLKEVTQSLSGVHIVFHGYTTHPSPDQKSTEAGCSDVFFKNQGGAKVAFCIETPYSGDLEVPYTPKLLRDWGENIIRAWSMTIGR